MASKKYYAIKAEWGVKVVETWEDCQALTRGEKGCKYKSFKSFAEADAWLKGAEVLNPSNAKYNKGLWVFVDGSFTPKCTRAGWGFVVIEEGNVLTKKSGITAFDAESRNIDGEVMASYQAMKWLFENNKKGIICHDYAGISHWALGSWKAKSNIAQRYVKAIQPYLQGISFEKVPAHTGLKWNEEVDKLAKKAIENYLKQLKTETTA